VTASGSIKRATCDALAAYLAARPELAGIPVKAVQADIEDDAECEHIVILPQRMEFRVWQELEADDTVPGKVLINLGDFEGNVEVRAAALSADKREELEEKIQAIFFERELAPGILTLQLDPINVGGVQYGLEPVVAYALDDEIWNEEKVFDAPRYSYLTVAVAFPALVTRNAYTIDQMIAALTTDLDSHTPDEQRLVNEDGSTTTL
jgi:hypothetical protein